MHILISASPGGQQQWARFKGFIYSQPASMRINAHWKARGEVSSREVLSTPADVTLRKRRFTYSRFKHPLIRVTSAEERDQQSPLHLAEGN